VIINLIDVNVMIIIHRSWINPSPDSNSGKRTLPSDWLHRDINSAQQEFRCTADVEPNEFTRYCQPVVITTCRPSRHRLRAVRLESPHDCGVVAIGRQSRSIRHRKGNVELARLRKQFGKHLRRLRDRMRACDGRSGWHRRGG
jgi:hypothetical protein